MAYTKYTLVEQRGFTPPKNPPKNIKNVLSQIELFEMYPKIFALVIKDNRLRARVFMRYQEFYESDSETLEVKGSDGTITLNFTRIKLRKIISHTTKTGLDITFHVIQLNLVWRLFLMLISMT